MIKKISLIFMFFFMVSPLLAAWQINEKVFNYYSDQDKDLEIDSDKKETAMIVLYKAGKSGEFINKFFPFTDQLNTSFPVDPPIVTSEHGWVSAYEKKYVCPPELKIVKENDLNRYSSWEWILNKKKTSFIIPVIEKGVFLMEIRTVEQTRYLLINVSDLALIIKRDKVRTLIYSVNRKTGIIIPVVNIKPEFYNDERNRHLFTGQNGLLFLDNKKFEKFGKISGSYSNNYDFIDASRFDMVQKENYKTMVFLDKEFYYKTDIIKLNVFFYKKDEFQDFIADAAESYKTVFQGITNEFDAKKSFFHETELNINPHIKAGIYPLIILYQDNIYTNRIPIINEHSRKIFIDIDASKSVYLLGEKVKIFTKIYNAAGNKLQNPAIRHEFQFYDLSTGELIKNTQSVESRLWRKEYNFSCRTRGWPQKNYRVRVKISIRFADGYILHSYKDFFILKAKDEIILSIPKKIYLTDEPVNMKIELKRYIDPIKIKTIDLTVIDKQKQGRNMFHKVIEFMGSTTNIIFNISRAGNFTITAKVNEKGIVQDKKDFWVVPKEGDIPDDSRTNGFVQIINDKDMYAFGDIARILLISKKKNINALFTCEGAGIFFSKPLEFQNNYEIIDLPILEQNKPNCFIVIQAMISNKLHVSSKDIYIPYQSKNIIYNITSSITDSKRRIFTATENIWGRDIGTFSSVSIVPVLVPVNRISSAYYQDLFYHRLSPMVQTYYSKYPQFNVYREKIYRDLFDVGSKDLFSFTQSEYLNTFISEQQTNSYLIDEDKYFDNSHLMMRINSVTRDGKLSSTNFLLSLNAPIEYSIFIPKYLHYGDKSLFSAYLKNLGDVRQKTRLRTEFISGDMYGYQTNFIFLAPRDGISTVSKIPLTPQAKDKIDFHFQGFSHKKNINIKREIEIFPWPSNIQYTTRFIAKKSYHKIFLNMFLIPQISFLRHRFKIEDTILVTISIKWKKNSLPESSSFYIRDIVPSGFQPVRLEFSNKKMQTITDYVQNEDYLEFKIDASKFTETMKINYLLKADVAGKYSFVEPLLFLDDLFLSSEKNPLSEKKMLSIDY